MEFRDWIRDPDACAGLMVGGLAFVVMILMLVWGLLAAIRWGVGC